MVTLFFIFFWIFSPKVDQSDPILKPVENKVQIVNIDTLPAEETIMDGDIIDLDTIVAPVDEVKQEEVTPPKPEIKRVQKINKKSHSNDGNCVIIVGAFKDTANAQRMMKNISLKGYNTFTSDHQGLKRVGVRYNCQGISPEAFKTKIRSQFNKEAWSLSDTI